MVSRLLRGAIWILTLVVFHGLVAPVQSREESKQLVEELQRLLQRGPLRRARVGLEVRDVANGQLLFSTRAEESFLPASNQKILTALAALEKWGPNKRFSTRLYRLGQIKDGKLWGDLVLQGTGDPGLETSSLYQMSQALVEQGIQQIAGDFVVDDFLFEPPNRRTLESSRIYSAPTGPLSLNRNLITLVVSGVDQSAFADLWYEPLAESFLSVQGRVRIASSSNFSLSRQVRSNRDEFRLWGRVAQGETFRFRRSISSGSDYAQSAWMSTWPAFGIELSGTVRREKLPPHAELLHEQFSAPLSILLHEQNKSSNNFLADQIFYLLGLSGELEAVQMASREAHQLLKGIGMTATDIADGSGLSRENWTTPQDLVRALLWARKRPYWPEFLASLPVGGQDGTLKSRFAGIQPGAVRAKTGHIYGVSTLSGYVLRPDGRLLAFSLLVNSIRSRGVDGLQDRIVETLYRSPIDEL